MLELSILELILRILPESCLLVLVAYVIANKRVEYKDYFKTVIILSSLVFIIRLLPINYGVHTLLNLIMLVVLLTSINKIDVNISIKSAVISILLLIISEGINLIIINKFFYGNVMTTLNSAKLRLIYGFPSLIIFLILLRLLFLMSRWKRKNA